MADRMLGVARNVLRVGNLLNWIGVALFVGALLLSFPFDAMVLDTLSAKYHRIDVMPVLWAMRMLALIGIVVGPVVHVIFSRLSAIVETAREGDPFVSINAARLQAIGWAMLALQVIDLVLGGMTGWLTVLHVDRLDWWPSIGGWLATLMIFVLARVFAIGTRMRDELEMTV